MKLSDLSMPAGARVDVIVRAKNGHEITERCIDSILANTPVEQYRLILVDDGSKPALELGADITIRRSESGGAVSATNLGLSVALLDQSAAYALVLDNDTRIPEGDTGWLGRMVAELEQGGPMCGAIGATTNFANPPQHALTAPQTYTASWKSERAGTSGEKENPDVPWFVSFAVLLRKSAIRAVGMWDTRYEPGNYEDTDYSIALRAAGYSLRVARSVYIHHDGHQTFREDLQRLLNENGRKFLEKWGTGRLFDMGIIPKQRLAEMLR